MTTPGLLVCSSPQMFACTHQGCGYMTSEKNHFSMHYHTMHSPQAGAIHQDVSNRIIRYLSGDFSVQRDVQITCNQKWGVPHPRIETVDITVAFPEQNVEVYIEVDTCQNKYGSLGVCGTLTRMLDISTATYMSGNTRDVLWIRFNPSSYSVDGTRRRQSMLERMCKLHGFLQSVRGGCMKGCLSNWGLSVQYMFYDTTNNKNSLLADPAYLNWFLNDVCFAII